MLVVDAAAFDRAIEALACAAIDVKTENGLRVYVSGPRHTERVRNATLAAVVSLIGPARVSDEVPLHWNDFPNNDQAKAESAA